MKRIYFCVLAVTLCFASCSSKTKDETTNKENVKSGQVSENNKSQTVVEENTSGVVLFEDRLGKVSLPFEHKEMLGELQKDLSDFSVTKEMGQQDGPDFPLYVIRNGEVQVGFLGMDWEDTLKLTEISVEQADIKDEYGVKVGDTYSKVSQLRKVTGKNYTDYHYHTYVYWEGSNILYELSGDPAMPDTADVETLHFADEQMQDWTVERIVWRKQNN